MIIIAGPEISESPVQADLHDLYLKCSFSVSLECLFNLNLKRELVISDIMKNYCLVSDTYIFLAYSFLMLHILYFSSLVAVFQSLPIYFKEEISFFIAKF